MLKADLIPLGNYTYSWPCMVPLRVGPREPAAFVIGQLVLHWS